MRIFILLFLCTTAFSQSIVINEVMSLNNTIIEDADNDYPDWIEIYNNSSSAINLENFGLSDDSDEPLKWTLPNVTIDAQSFMLIFASDKDRKDGELHANFKIKSRGEKIILADASGTILDSLTIPPLAVDISYGRSPDGAPAWAYFVSPTPGQRNITEPSEGYSTPPIFSKQGGIYPGSVILELGGTETGWIRYTTDGADPGKSSRSYRTPISIDKTTVIKARLFEDGKLPSPVVTHTFFINENSGIPLVSLSTHPDNFFDDDIGIYVEGNGTAMGGYPSNPIGPPANYWEDWERPIHIELYEPNGQLGFSENAGVKMSGKTTRKLPQKSFAVFLRSQYGNNELEYPLFDNYPVTRFKSFVLRNGGSDNTVNEGGVQFRDGLTSLLVQDLDIDNQAYRPCHLYLNGEYWGIYSIREKLNEDYLASHHGVDPDRVNMLDDYHTLYPLVIEGTAEEFNSLIDYMDEHDLSDDTHAEFINSRIDVDNYLTYMVAQIFLANHDGPGHNCKFWAPQGGGRYRWILYDTDHTLGMRLFIPNFHFAGDDGFMDNTIAYYREENGPSWPNPPESTFIFRKILENENFRYLFINKLADYMNTVFQPNATLPKLEQISALLDPEINKHFDRWGGSKSTWRRNIGYINTFLAERSYYVQDHVIDEFRLGGLAEVTLKIEPASSGQIKLNSLYIKKNWTGMYFRDVPIQVQAIPHIGYKFTGWKEVADNIQTITPDGDITLTAQFEQTNDQDVIVFNEINYNSPPDFDTGDWIELYNPMSRPVDLSNWILADDDSSADFVFPSNTIMSAHDFMIIVRDVSKFKALYPDQFVISNLPFGLNSGGDHISLLNSTGQIVDSLTYENSSPWPWQPDGDGATLALRDPNFDNNNPDNWMASFHNGTPGTSNRVIGQVEKKSIPQNFVLKSAYPNPFNSSTKIDVVLPHAQHVSLNIYDVLGRHVKTLVDEKLSGGFHSYTWEATDDLYAKVASGIYIVVLKTDEDHHIQKVALVY